MRPETIIRSTSSKTCQETLLCVHGASVGAWSFNRFPDVANNRGFDVILMNMRGHGQNDGHDMDDAWTLEDYGDDLISVLGSVSGPVTIIAHSMGGAVVQKALHRLPGHVRHVVLLCSPPPAGIDRQTPLGMFYSDRLNMVRDHRRANPGQGLDDLVRSVLFGASMTDDEAKEILGRFTKESLSATSGLLSPLVEHKTARYPRISVAGTSADRLITPDIVEATAAYYGTKAHIVGHLPHFLFFHPEADRASNTILDIILDTHHDT